MSFGTGTDTEFDDVRHGYAPPRQKNPVVPPPHIETRAEDLALGFVDAPYQQSGNPDDRRPDDHGPVQFDETALEDASSRPGIGDTVNTLIDSGKAVYEAEIALVKARVDVIASATKSAAVFVSFAAMSGLVFLLALGFGAISILGEYLTRTQAVLIVAVSLAATTLIASWLAKRQFDRITRAIWERNDG